MLNYLNEKAKNYEPLFKIAGVFLTVIGIYITFFQILQTNNELRRSNYKFNREQLPTVNFDPINKKQGLLQVSFLQSDMLFQECKVFYHESLLNGYQEMIRMHDSIWYNSTLLANFREAEKFNKRFQKLMKKNEFNSYINLRTPVLLEINYVKYGESRIAYGIFDLEFSYFKDYKHVAEKFDSQIRAVYFKKYLIGEEFERYVKDGKLVKDPLKNLEMFEVVSGA